MRTTGPLIKITAELRPNGLWECIRERRNGGEKLSGARSIKEVIQFIEAHDHEWEIFLNDSATESDNESL